MLLEKKESPVLNATFLRRPARARLLFAALLLGPITACVSAPAQEYPVTFTVTMENPQLHYYGIELRVPEVPAGESLDLIMPVWIPGSYMIREYPQYVNSEAAHDLAGNPLPFVKVTKNRWRVQTAGAGGLVFTYRVFAYEQTIRHAYLDEEQAIINGPHLFMFPEPFKDSPVRVEIRPGEGFERIATGLDSEPGAPFTLHADNFDQLFDSPVEMGDIEILRFRVDGVPHEIAVSGPGRVDGPRLIRHTRRIVETAVSVIGEIPYDRYVFMMAQGVDGGGLEHANSTFLGFPGGYLDSEDHIRQLLGLVAHEFFHVWNVKRIRPIELGPFDYSRENYTRSLWVAEGLTVYYDKQIRRRAGYLSPEEFLEELQGEIFQYLFQPGHLRQSPEEASFDAWIKTYYSHAETFNTTFSYYTSGNLIGAMLDLDIIAATGGEKSLDDVMRYLWVEYYRGQDRGYTPAEFQGACETVAGKSYEEFFDSYIRSRTELEFDPFLAHAGLRLGRGPDPADEGPYMGVSLNTEGDQVRISGLIDGTPGWDQGLSVGDEIVAINGVRFEDYAGYRAEYGKSKPGDTIQVTVRRNGEERTIPITQSGWPLSVSIQPVENPTPEQRMIYDRWLRTDHD